MPKFSDIFKLTHFKNKKNAETSSSPPTAIQQLREMEELLSKKQLFLEGKIEAEKVIIKENIRTNKRIALQALKRKKRYEKQLQQLDGTLSTIEMQREALEGANTNTEVLKFMTQASNALKSVHKNMDVDKIHDIMDDIADQQDLAKEISEAISNPLAFGQGVDDDELEKELEAMEQEELDALLLSLDKPNELVHESNSDSGNSKSGVKIPLIAKNPTLPNTDEDEECKELVKWAAQ